MTEQTEAHRLADTPFALRDGRWNFDADDELRRLHILNGELLEALKECLPYVGQTLANTGSMDAYHTEEKAFAAIAKATGEKT
jgi:hypothetical protein